MNCRKLTPQEIKEREIQNEIQDTDKIVKGIHLESATFGHVVVTEFESATSNCVISTYQEELRMYCQPKGIQNE
ncbi:MAG: hypothetical protein WC783_02930 [Candidatus Paceibacterota bacterium]